MRDVNSENSSLGLFSKYSHVLISLKKDSLEIKTNTLWI